MDWQKTIAKVPLPPTQSINTHLRATFLLHFLSRFRCWSFSLSISLLPLSLSPPLCVKRVCMRLWGQHLRADRPISFNYYCQWNELKGGFKFCLIFLMWCVCVCVRALVGTGKQEDKHFKLLHLKTVIMEVMQLCARYTTQQKLERRYWQNLHVYTDNVPPPEKGLWGRRECSEISKAAMTWRACAKLA
jgi:hypothetical protein